MSLFTTPLTGTSRVIALGFFGAFAGYVIASFGNPLPLTRRTTLVPAPYRTAKFPNGTVLRMAMVHDVLHERYLRHGDAWYLQRNADAEKIIAKAGTETGKSMAADGTLDAMDDLAVGLSRLGKMDQAIEVCRKKLKLVSRLPATAEPTTRQEAGLPQDFTEQAVDADDLRRIIRAGNIDPFVHYQYTTLANLGTIQLLKVLPAVLHKKPDAAAKDKLQECLAEIEQAVAINPAGHFGRETWQAILIRHLLAGIDHPELIGEYDFTGQKLNDDAGTQETTWFHRRAAAIPFEPSPSDEKRLEIRRLITRVGMDDAWIALVHPRYPVPMPFDEPALAIVGMWTQGGGPNPHFALALGRIMENVGQRQIAWEAYERAIDMQADFWPEESVRAKLVAFCRERQSAIALAGHAGSLAGWEKDMRARHESELAWGIAYQKQYQDFEAGQIAAGVPLDRADFYKRFFDSHAPVASATGTADDLVVTEPVGVFEPCVALGAGLGMMLGVLYPGRPSRR